VLMSVDQSVINRSTTEVYSGHREHGMLHTIVLGTRGVRPYGRRTRLEGLERLPHKDRSGNQSVGLKPSAS
jgi:hypothetical protein